MEKSTIIKLRQSEATETESNGSYTVTLDTPVIMREGDSMKVHTVVLDTATESVVNVENDLQIEMTTARYFRCYKFNEPFEVVVNPAQSPGVSQQGVIYPLPNLRLAWVSVRDTSIGDNFFVDSLVMRTDSTNIARDFGRDYPVSFEYFSAVDGSKQFDQFDLPSHAIISHMNSGILIPINKRVRGKFFKLTISNKELSRKAGVYEFSQEQNLSKPGFGTPENPVRPSLTSGLASSVCWGVGDVQPGFPNGKPGGVLSLASESISLYEETLKFKLPASTYTPTEIAQIINGKMTALNSLPGNIGYNGPGGLVGAPGQGKFLVNNPFLTSVAQLRAKIDYAGGSNRTSARVIFSPGNTTETATEPGPAFGNDYILDIVDIEGSYLENAKDRWVGASQVSMNFDTNLKKLNFDALHFPAYGTTAEAAVGDIVPGVDYSNIPGTEFLQPQNTPAIQVPVEPQANYGGVGFTGLRAFNLDTVTDSQGVVTEQVGKFSPFWDTLGFGSSVLVRANDIGTAIPLDDSGSVFPIQVVADLGINIVGGDPTIDGLVRKETAANKPVGLPFVGFVANNLTTPILSQRTFDEAPEDEGYYMLEINMKFPQTLIGGSRLETETNSNSVQSIIGKYFTSGNFLQSQGAGEIMYTHVGEPQLINDLQVRILHPDFSVPTDIELGKKNSIFLEIIKPIQVQQPPVKK